MTSYEYPPVGGGGGQVVQGLAERLVSGGDEVDVLTMGCDGISRFETRKGVRIHRSRSLRRHPSFCSVPAAGSYLLGAPPILARLLESHSYDIVHSHFIFPDGLLVGRAARRSGLDYVLTAHGPDVPGHDPRRARLLHRLLGPVWRPLTNDAASVVCASEALKLRIERASRRPLVDVIPNAFEARRFDPFGPRVERILAVGRMVEEKGFQYLLRALKGFRDEYEVVLVGDGPFAGQLRRLASRLGVRARFTGWLENRSPELKRLYETSSILVCPSLAENFPVVLLEAMAAGTAIVTTTDAGCSGVVGDTALLVPPGDAAGIRLALEVLVKDPERARGLARAARNRLEREFGWEQVVESYREIYRRHAKVA